MTAKLFTPLTLGGKSDPIQLLHRIVMAPCTRLRASETGVQIPLAAEYYSQRSTPGGLLISEATNISATANGYFRAPGLFTKEQVESWKPVTKAVHDKEGKIFVQLWHTGRVSHPLNQPNGQLPVSSSATPFADETGGTVSITSEGRQPYEVPRALELEEIPAILEDYRKAALSAIEAGFDGVELHAANGYLLEQFLCDSANKRTDKYGGSLENRARIIFEVLDAITSAIPSSKVGIRLSPFGVTFACTDSNPEETYRYVVDKLNAYDLAYLHVVEPRAVAFKSDKVPESGITSLFRKVYTGAYITSCGYDRAEAIKTVEDQTADLVAFGRDFIATPDLVQRLEKDLPLNQADYNTFYIANGDMTHPEKGYTDYPFAESAP